MNLQNIYFTNINKKGKNYVNKHKTVCKKKTIIARLKFAKTNIKNLFTYLYLIIYKRNFEISNSDEVYSRM